MYYLANILIFLQPTKFAIGSSDKNEFQTEFIYLTFYSLTGCSITITVNFGDPNQVEKGKKTKNDNNEEEDYQEKEERLKRENDMFEKIMKKNREKMSKIDFIQKNADMVTID